MIINCPTPNCKGKLDCPMDLDYSIDVIQCGKCLTLWDMRFGEPEPYIREQHMPDTRSLPVGETPKESEPLWDYEKREAKAHSNIIEPQWTRRQWDAVTQLKGLVLHYQSKVLTLLESKKKGKCPLKEYD